MGRTEMTVTVNPRKGVEIAIRLFRDSIVAATRRTSVTFTAGQS